MLPGHTLFPNKYKIATSPNEVMILLQKIALVLLAPMEDTDTGLTMQLWAYQMPQRAGVVISVGQRGRDKVQFFIICLPRKHSFLNGFILAWAEELNLCGKSKDLSGSLMCVYP